jgi:hypothetical protein
MAKMNSIPEGQDSDCRKFKSPEFCFKSENSSVGIHANQQLAWLESPTRLVLVLAAIGIVAVLGYGRIACTHQRWVKQP